MKISRAMGASLFLLVLLATAACGRTQVAPTAKPSTHADLFAYDRTQPLNPDLVLSEERPEQKVYKLTYSSVNSQRVPAFFVLPAAAAAGKTPVVVLMHGLGQDKKALAMLWGTLTKGGYAVLAIDALFHGDRKPSTAVEIFGTDIDATKELLVQTVIDLRRGIDYLQTRKEIDPKRIGYIGFSMGEILGALTAGVDDRIQAPILALAGGNWKLMAETSTLAQAIKARETRGKDGISWQALDPLDPVHFAGKIAPRPVLFINGDNDTVVPVACAKDLHAAAGAGKVVVMYKGGHVPAGVEFIRVIGKMTQWLDAHLK